MICAGCGRLTLLKKYCADCERNETLFQKLPTREILRLQPQNQDRTYLGMKALLGFITHLR
jgi:hypothetical protein